MVLLGVMGSFLFPSRRCLLLKVSSEMIGMHYLSAEMSSSFSLTFISALITRCFAVECKIRPLLTYLKKTNAGNTMGVEFVEGDQGSRRL